VRVEQRFSLNRVSQAQVDAALNHIRTRLSQYDVRALDSNGQIAISIEVGPDATAARFVAIVTVDRVLEEAGLSWPENREWIELPVVIEDGVCTSLPARAIEIDAVAAVFAR
jgi:hypothetical protein